MNCPTCFFPYFATSFSCAEAGGSRGGQPRNQLRSVVCKAGRPSLAVVRPALQPAPLHRLDLLHPDVVPGFSWRYPISLQRQHLAMHNFMSPLRVIHYYVFSVSIIIFRVFFFDPASSEGRVSVRVTCGRSFRSRSRALGCCDADAPLEERLCSHRSRRAWASRTLSVEVSTTDGARDACLQASGASPTSKNWRLCWLRARRP